MYSLPAEPIVLETGAVTAVDDRVAVEARSRTLRTNGVRFANEYYFLFRIRDGRIVEVREHNNTAHAARSGVTWAERCGAISSTLEGAFN